MLIDIKTRAANVLDLIIGPQNIERLDQGLYLCNHWPASHIIGGKTFVMGYELRSRFHEAHGSKKPLEEMMDMLLPFDEYGVVDYPLQLLEKVPRIKTDPELFFVTFVKIVKADQSDWGGWRWHKWGPYIGDKKPQHEYIYQEGPDITEVYTFSIHELTLHKTREVPTT